MAAPALRKANVKGLSLEAKTRLEKLLAAQEQYAPTSEHQRAMRAVEVLTLIGGDQAKASLETLAKQAFRLLDCRDYARVDFRVRPGNRPYILEVNPNPDYSPLAGLSGGLGSAGLTHPQFTVELVQRALARAKGKLGGVRVGS